MFSKLKSLAKFKKKDLNLVNIAALQEEFSDGLYKVMEKSFDKRKSDTNNSKFTEK